MQNSKCKSSMQPIRGTLLRFSFCILHFEFCITSDTTKPPALVAERIDLCWNHDDTVDVAGEHRAIEDVEVAVRDAKHVPDELSRQRQRTKRCWISRRNDAPRARLGAGAGASLRPSGHRIGHQLKIAQRAVRASEVADAIGLACIHGQADGRVVRTARERAAGLVALISNRRGQALVSLLDVSREDIAAAERGLEGGADTV